MSEYPADHLGARAEWVREREAKRAAPTDLRADVLLLAEAIQRLASVLEFVPGAQPGWVKDARRAAEEVIVRCRVGDRDAADLEIDVQAKIAELRAEAAMPSGVTPQDQYPTAGLSAADRGSVDNFKALVKRVEEDRRLRENRISVLLGRLEELAAEGYSMSAEEVRFQHGVLPR
jgi:hypothetical protein